jgi:hypothetical protein
MRTIALLVCALILSGSAALAEPKKSVKAAGCMSTIGTCLLLRSGNGGFFLTGSDLPQPGEPKQITVRGTLSRGEFLCPTRLIIEGTINVTRWKAGRRTCKPG